MKRAILTLVALATAFYLGGASASAQGPRGGGPPNALHGASSTHGAANPKRDVSKDPSSVVGRKTPTDMLTHNTKLASKLQTLLGSKMVGPSPAPYATVEAAAQGFKNLGQFVAAVHVCHNLGIPFDTLKQKMMGGDSLGKAIHEMNPNVDAKAEAKKAKKQSDDEIKESNS